MKQTIETVRKSLSNIYHWLTDNDNLRFLKDENNKPNTMRSIHLDDQLKLLMPNSRGLLNKLSETLENIEVCQRNLRLSVEKDKLEQKKRAPKSSNFLE